jgi:hypothetical protein
MSVSFNKNKIKLYHSLCFLTAPGKGCLGMPPAASMRRMHPIDLLLLKKICKILYPARYFQVHGASGGHHAAH